MSGSASQQRRTEPSRVSRRPMASVEQREPSRTTARARVPERHVSPTGPASAQNENCWAAATRVLTGLDEAPRLTAALKAAAEMLESVRPLLARPHSPQAQTPFTRH